MKKIFLSLFIILLIFSLPSSAGLHLKRPRPPAPPVVERPLTINDFDYSIPLTLKEGEAFYELTVPEDVYVHTADDYLRDVRLFNATGQMVPYMIQGLEEKIRAETTKIPMRIFPVTQRQNTLGGEGLSLIVNKTQQGTYVNINSQGAKDNKAADQVVAYLIDGTETKQSLSAFIVDFKKRGGSLIKKITIESSDDLQYWSAVVYDQTIAAFDYQDQHILKNRIEFNPVSAKYFRLTSSDGLEGLEISAIHAESVSREKIDSRIWRAVRATAQKGEYIFESGGHFYVSLIQIKLPERNTLIKATLSLCGEPCVWTPYYNGQFYRLMQGGVEFEGGEIDYYGSIAPHFKLVVSPNGGSLGAGLPLLRYAYTPQRLVFLAQGSAPFTLAYGSKRAGPPDYDVAGIFSSIRGTNSTQLPKALAGEPVKLKKNAESAAPSQKGIGIKNIILWSVMIAGVGLLIYLAARLAKQLRG
ncbi:MAG: DUF3999 domain-containing protein [Deltaproteobacteria bacterium]|nr:DUF3999 domain-containing protein [Deltaproteobacteria bacterium]